MTIGRGYAFQPEMIGKPLFGMISPEGAAWRQSLSREPFDPLDLLGIDRDDHLMGRVIGMVYHEEVMIERS